AGAGAAQQREQQQGKQDGAHNGVSFGPVGFSTASQAERAGYRDSGLLEALAGEHHHLGAGELDADEALLDAPGAAGQADGAGALVGTAEQALHLALGHAGLELGIVLLVDLAAGGEQDTGGENGETTRRHWQTPGTWELRESLAQGEPDCAPRTSEAVDNSRRWENFPAPGLRNASPAARERPAPRPCSRGREWRCGEGSGRSGGSPGDGARQNRGSRRTARARPRRPGRAAR